MPSCCKCHHYYQSLGFETLKPLWCLSSCILTSRQLGRPLASPSTLLLTSCSLGPGPRSVASSPCCLLPQFLAVVLVSSSPVPPSQNSSSCLCQIYQSNHRAICILHDCVGMIQSCNRYTIDQVLWEADAGTVLACKWFVRDLGALPVKEEGRGSRIYQGRSSVHSAGLTLWKGEEKGRRNESGQGEPQLTVHMWQNLNQCHEIKRSNRALPCWAVSHAHSGLGCPGRVCLGWKTTEKSEDTIARDFQLIAFLVAKWVVSHFWKGDVKYCTSGTTAYAWVPSSNSAWFRTLGVRNKMKHLHGTYILVEGNRQ